MMLWGELGMRSSYGKVGHQREVQVWARGRTGDRGQVLDPGTSFAGHGLDMTDIKPPSSLYNWIVAFFKQLNIKSAAYLHQISKYSCTTLSKPT